MLYYSNLFILAALGFYDYRAALVDACSSRTVPKPRPSVLSSSISAAAGTSSLPFSTTPKTIAPSTTTPSTTTTTTTPRPNITFPTYKCPETFDAWYCLNEATCFAVKIGDLPVYSCECATGFMGQRCEYKELDGSYMPKRPRPLLEKASIASGAMCALIFMLFICLTLYLKYDQKATIAMYTTEQIEEYSTYYIMPRNNGKCCCGQHCSNDGDSGAGVNSASVSGGGGGGTGFAIESEFVNRQPILLRLYEKLNYRQRLENALHSFTIKRFT